MLNLGDVFPDFSADSSIGEIKFHEFIGDSWCILFSHPADFTPVCTTELARLANLAPEFAKRKTKLAALSCDDAQSHRDWIQDVRAYCKMGNYSEFPFPIIADEKRELAVKLGMLDADEKDSKGLPLTARAVFVIAPDKKLKLSILYPATSGRNFDEILRVLDSLQLTATQPLATPADWTPGSRCMIQPSLPKEDAKKLFPDHEIIAVPSGKSYIRMTPQP